MRRIGHVVGKSVALVLLLGAVLAWPITAATPTAKPEDVGFSSERLHRINDLVQRHITAGSFSGAVTLVARSGRIAHFEAHGVGLSEGRFFGARPGEYVRLNFGCPRATLDEALRRMTRAVAAR